MDQSPVFFTSHANFGDERYKDSHHPCFHTGHKIGHSCSDYVKMEQSCLQCWFSKVNRKVALLTMFTTGCEDFCQENAWMNEGAML